MHPASQPLILGPPTRDRPSRVLFSDYRSPRPSITQRIQNLETVPFQARQAQNKPRSAIGADDLTSRSFHVDLHADLHDIQNARPAHNTPGIARLAQILFNQLDPSPEISKTLILATQNCSLCEAWKRL